jgi:hypothetical protein
VGFSSASFVCFVPHSVDRRGVGLKMVNRVRIVLTLPTPTKSPRFSSADLKLFFFFMFYSRQTKSEICFGRTKAVLFLYVFVRDVDVSAGRNDVEWLRRYCAT